VSHFLYFLLLRTKDRHKKQIISPIDACDVRSLRPFQVKSSEEARIVAHRRNKRRYGLLTAFTCDKMATALSHPAALHFSKHNSVTKACRNEYTGYLALQNEVTVCATCFKTETL
jgi:hypothetical protein